MHARWVSAAAWHPAQVSIVGSAATVARSAVATPAWQVTQPVAAWAAIAAWAGLVFPCLLLNYFGQGALILAEPEAAKNPFFLSAPDWALYPLIGLATVATVIASQAVISGAFSISRQAMQLGFMPRMEVQYTSEKEQGQIYLPAVNWGLMLAVMILVLGFKSSNNLAAAYGIAVTGDMVITSLLATVVVARGWGWGWAAGFGFAF